MQTHDGTTGIIFGDPCPLRDALSSQLGLPSVQLVSTDASTDCVREISSAGASRPTPRAAPKLVVNLISPGSFSSDGLPHIEFDAFCDRLESQIATPWKLIKRLLPEMRAAGGVIVNVLQESEQRPDMTESISMLTRCAALEGGAPSAPTRVHTVLVARNTPLNDVVESVSFLCSDSASFMSGNILRLGTFA